MCYNISPNHQKNLTKSPHPLPDAWKGCLRPHKRYSNGYEYLWPCMHHYCPSVKCREAWSEKEYKFLKQCHTSYPWEYVCCFRPNKVEDLWGKRQLVSQTATQIKKWCDNHEEWIDICLYPEKHDRSHLHWQGVIRCSSLAVITKLRELWYRNYETNRWSLTVVRRRSEDEFMRYCCGYGYQKGMKVLDCEGLKLVICKGHWERVKPR